MFQNAAKNLSIDYDNKKVQDNDKILSYCNRSILCKISETNKIQFPIYKDFKNLKSEELIYMFSVNGERFFLSLCENLKVCGFEYKDINVIRNTNEDIYQYAGITGYHYYCFHVENKFCGKCGGILQHKPEKRCMICSCCGNEAFPKISPAVIVGIIDEQTDSILMTRYANGEYKKLALVAGFIEMGESAEQGVVREVKEETGLCIDKVCYYNSQPWGFAQNLLIGYFARVCGSRDILMDSEELSEALWVNRANVEAYPNSISLTGEMLWDFKNNTKAKRWRDIL